MLLIAGLINAQLFERLWAAAAVMAALVYGTQVATSKSPTCGRVKFPHPRGGETCGL
ncbi:MAG: hypothetical protein ACREXW_21000 [Gammaproteobacteria bacterium]